MIVAGLLREISDIRPEAVVFGNCGVLQASAAPRHLWRIPRIAPLVALAQVTWLAPASAERLERVSDGSTNLSPWHRCRVVVYHALALVVRCASIGRA
jgi:hypothetical protein